MAFTAAATAAPAACLAAAFFLARFCAALLALLLVLSSSSCVLHRQLSQEMSCSVSRLHGTLSHIWQHAADEHDSTISAVSGRSPAASALRGPRLPATAVARAGRPQRCQHCPPAAGAAHPVAPAPPAAGPSRSACAPASSGLAAPAHVLTSIMPLCDNPDCFALQQTQRHSSPLCISAKLLMCTVTTRPAHLPHNGCNFRPWQDVRIDSALDLLFGIAACRHHLRKRSTCCLRRREQSLDHMQIQRTAYDDTGRMHAAKRRKHNDKIVHRHVFIGDMRCRHLCLHTCNTGKATWGTAEKPESGLACLCIRVVR